MLHRQCQLVTSLRLDFAAWQLRQLVLPASQLQSIIDDVGETSWRYKGHAGFPLSVLSGYRRGVILQELCKKELAEMYPVKKIRDAIRGTRSDGTLRGSHQSEYDFLLDERRIECKSALMSWDKCSNSWQTTFTRVKLPLKGVREQAPFDDLYLSVLSPDSVHIIKHDLKSRVSRAGLSTGTCGYKINARGKRHQECLKVARSEILGKLIGQGSVIAQIELTALNLHTWLARLALPQDEAFRGVPLSALNPALRGLRVQQVAYEVDQALNRNSIFSTDCPGADWTRNGIRVEVKHGQMCFKKVEQKWICTFSCIKSAAAGARDHDFFDELWLVVYSPLGLHFLKHPGSTRLYVATGLRTYECGNYIFFAGPAVVQNVQAALETILRKMEVAGCQQFAEIQWDT